MRKTSVLMHEHFAVQRFMRYNKSMVEIVIGKNEEGQRLDRFLRKYLTAAPLSHIYRIIRKDVKVNGKRAKDDYDLNGSDVIQLYLNEDEIKDLRGARGEAKAKPVKKTFRIAYEDDDILICDKPAGLLTHGDKTEKSNHLTNQVQGYLMGKGEFDPADEKTFSPSPVNRIDRNTTGLVIFAKNYDALKKLNSLIRNREKIRKFYLTVVSGVIGDEVTLTGMIEKDEARNVSRMTGGGASIGAVGSESSAAGREADAAGFETSAAGSESSAAGREAGAAGSESSATGREAGAAGSETAAAGPEASAAGREAGATGSGKIAVTHVKPVLTGRIPGIPGGFFTVAEVEIETGRTHQIRVQLAESGHPLAGDPKYGETQVNKALRDRFGLTHQLLTAWKLEFGDLDADFPEISNKTVHAKLPKDFDQIKAAIQKSTKKSMGKGKRA